MAIRKAGGPLNYTPYTFETIKPKFTRAERAQAVTDYTKGDEEFEPTSFSQFLVSFGGDALNALTAIRNEKEERERLLEEGLRNYRLYADPIAKEAWESEEAEYEKLKALAEQVERYGVADETLLTGAERRAQAESAKVQALRDKVIEDPVSAEEYVRAMDVSTPTDSGVEFVEGQPGWWRENILDDIGAKGMEIGGPIVRESMKHVAGLVNQIPGVREARQTLEDQAVYNEIPDLSDLSDTILGLVNQIPGVPEARQTLADQVEFLGMHGSEIQKAEAAKKLADLEKTQRWNAKQAQMAQQEKPGRDLKRAMDAEKAALTILDREQKDAAFREANLIGGTEVETGTDAAGRAILEKEYGLRKMEQMTDEQSDQLSKDVEESLALQALDRGPTTPELAARGRPLTPEMSMAMTADMDVTDAREVERQRRFEQLLAADPNQSMARLRSDLEVGETSNIKDLIKQGTLVEINKDSAALALANDQIQRLSPERLESIIGNMNMTDAARKLAPNVIHMTRNGKMVFTSGIWDIWERRVDGNIEVMTTTKGESPPEEDGRPWTRKTLSSSSLDDLKTMVAFSQAG